MTSSDDPPDSSTINMVDRTEELIAQVRAGVQEQRDYNIRLQAMLDRMRRVNENTRRLLNRHERRRSSDSLSSESTGNQEGNVDDLDNDANENDIEVITIDSEEDESFTDKNSTVEEHESKPLINNNACTSEMARIDDTDRPSTSKHVHRVIETSTQPPPNEEHSDNVSEHEISAEQHTESSTLQEENQQSPVEPRHQSTNQIDGEEMEEGEINSTSPIASNVDEHNLFCSVNQILVEQPCIIDLTLESEPEDESNLLIDEPMDVQVKSEVETSNAKDLEERSPIDESLIDERLINQQAKSPIDESLIDESLIGKPCIIDLVENEDELLRCGDEFTTEHNITEEEERLLLDETTYSEQSVNELPAQQTSIVSDLRRLENNEEQTFVIEVGRLEQVEATFEATETVQQTPVTPRSGQNMFNFILMNRDELNNLESQPIDELEDLTQTSSTTSSPSKTPNTERKCADCQTPLEKKGKFCGKCYYRRRKDYEKRVEDAILEECTSSATEKRHSAARECNLSDTSPDRRKRHHSRSSKKSVASRGSQERSCSVNEEDIIYLSDDDVNVVEDRAGTSQETAKESANQQIEKELPSTSTKSSNQPKARNMAFKTIQPGSSKRKDRQASSTASNQVQPSTEFIPSSPPSPYILPASISSNSNASNNLNNNTSTSSNRQIDRQVPLSPGTNLNTENSNRLDSPEQNLENNAFYSTTDTSYRGPFRNITSRFGNVEESSDSSAINPELRNRQRNSGVLSRFDGSSSLFRSIGFQRRFGQQAENINNRHNSRPFQNTLFRAGNDTGRPLNPNAPHLSSRDLIQMADDVIVEREAQEREERNAREQLRTTNEDQQTLSSGTVEVKVGPQLDPSAWQHTQSNNPSSSNQNPNTPPILSPIEPPKFTPPSSVGANSPDRLNDFDDNVQPNSSSDERFVRPRNPSGNLANRFVENDLDSCAGQWEAPISDPYAFTSDSQIVDEELPGSSAQQDNDVNTDSTSRQLKSTNQRRRMPATTNKKLYEKNRVKSFFQLSKVRKRVAPKKKLNLMSKQSTSALSGGKTVQEMMQSFGEIFDEVANEESSSSANNDDSQPKKCIECRQSNLIVSDGRCQKCKKNYQKRQQALKMGIQPQNTRCPGCNQIKPLMGRQNFCRSCYQKNQRQKQIKRAQIIARQEQLQKKNQIVRCTKCQKEINADQCRSSTNSNCIDCHIRDIKQEPKDYESCLGCNSYKPIYQNQRCYHCYERSQQSTSGQQNQPNVELETPNNNGNAAENPIAMPVDQQEQDPLAGLLNRFANANANDDGSSNGSNASIITLSSAEAVTNTLSSESEASSTCTLRNSLSITQLGENSSANEPAASNPVNESEEVEIVWENPAGNRLRRPSTNEHVEVITLSDDE